MVSSIDVRQKKKDKQYTRGTDEFGVCDKMIRFFYYNQPNGIAKHQIDESALRVCVRCVQHTSLTGNGIFAQILISIHKHPSICQLVSVEIVTSKNYTHKTYE